MTTASELPVESLRRRGYPRVAWAAIALAVATAFVGQLVLDRKGEAKKQTAGATFEFQARQLIGRTQFGDSQRDKVYQEAESLNTGPEAQRLRFVVLAGELRDPDEALKQLHKLDPPLADPHAAELLQKVYEDYRDERLNAPSLMDDDRQELHDKLGWFGDLALNPPDGPDSAARAAVVGPAKNAVLFLFAVVFGFVGLVGVGVALLVGMTILLAQRKARLRFNTGSLNGGIYAETFALWMVVFLGLGLLASFLPTGENRLLVSGLLALSSLAVLAWPVLRGVPWPTVRREIGLVWKDRTSAPRAVGWSVLLEPIYGLASYTATLPLLLVGALLTFGLIHLSKALFGEGGGPLGIGSDPSHPIAGILLKANWWGKLQVILAASVGAPIIEETMFRGVLYRHLREATGRWGRALSFLASAVLVSFVFAVIHPQGVLAVPVLMSLAVGFSMAREWRGTLIPSMVAHGLNNTMVTVLLLVSAS